MTANRVIDNELDDSATLRAIFDSVSEGLVVAGEGGSIRFANRTAESLFGYQPGQLAGLPVEALIPRRVADTHRHHRAGFFTAPKSRPMGQGLDLQAVRKDGTEFPVEVSLSFVETAQGKLGIAFVTDITHRKKLEYERDRFFNLSADLNCIGGAGGFLTQVNAAFETVLGWSRTELLSQPFLDFVHPGDREAAGQALTSLMNGRPIVQFETRLRCRDGSYRWLSWSAPAPEPGSGLFYASARDITPDRVAQAERKRLIALIENSGDMIGLMSMDGSIVYLNRAGCTMAGFASLDEARGHSIGEVIQGGAMLLALELDERWRGEDTVRHRASGQAVPLDVNAFAVKTGDEKVWAVVAHDVSRRKRSQQKLQALAAQLLNVQEEERRRIARELHDDITQKLAMLGIEVGLIHRDLVDAHRVGEDRLSFVQDQVVRLSEDVRQLSHQLHPSVLEHSGLAPALQAFCREISRQTGIEVRAVIRDVPEGIPRPVATGFYRIAQEALRNVAKHSGAKSASVTLSFEQGVLRLSIIDDGCGFDLGAQEASPGIGMIGMRERVRLIDGELSVDSEPGEGARLVVEARIDQ